jgi:hypothetical protein
MTNEGVDSPSTAVGEGWYKGVFGNEPAAHLRTKSIESMYPDITEIGRAVQTRKPVPPTALEIEASPGVWEPLIEYMKKRGGK